MEKSRLVWDLFSKLFTFSQDAKARNYVSLDLDWLPSLQSCLVGLVDRFFPHRSRILALMYSYRESRYCTCVRARSASWVFVINECAWVYSISMRRSNTTYGISENRAAANSHNVISSSCFFDSITHHTVQTQIETHGPWPPSSLDFLLPHPFDGCKMWTHETQCQGALSLKFDLESQSHRTLFPRSLCLHRDLSLLETPKSPPHFFGSVVSRRHRYTPTRCSCCTSSYLVWSRFLFLS